MSLPGLPVLLLGWGLVWFGCGWFAGWLADLLLLFRMLGREAANIGDSNQKLEEIEVQVRVRLEKAKEVVGCCCLDDPNLKTQEEQMSEL